MSEQTTYRKGEIIADVLGTVGRHTGRNLRVNAQKSKKKDGEWVNYDNWISVVLPEGWEATEERNLVGAYIKVVGEVTIQDSGDYKGQPTVWALKPPTIIGRPRRDSGSRPETGRDRASANYPAGDDRVPF